LTNKKKHILILPKWYPNPQDVQLGVFIQNQAILLSPHYQVTVLFVMGFEDCSKLYTSKVINHNGIQEIRIYFRKKTGIARFMNLFKYQKAQKMGYHLISDPIDIVHVQVPIRPALLAKKLLSKENIPYIITEHWSGHLNGQFENKSFIYKYLYKDIIDSAAEATVVSESLKIQIDKICRNKVKIVPNFINSANKSIEKKEHSIAQVITVCDLNNKTKNIIGLLKAFRLVIQTGQPAQLSIIGDGPDYQLILDYIRNNNLSDNVTLLGRLEQKQVLDLLPSYHFYICNSHVETFGMTVAEAILAGLPVICSRCGGPQEFVNDQNGILIPVNDVDALKTAIQTMILNYKNYNSYANYEAITTQFGKKAIVEKWKAVYEPILNG